MSSKSSFTPSKRHSFHTYSISGPKPLQLLTGQTSSAARPSPPTLATSDHRPSSPTRNKPRILRRQSSISYKRSSCDSLTQSRSPDEIGSSPQLQHRLGGGKPRPRSVAYPGAPLLTPPAYSAEDRPPLTLSEKHADLLRFIAQKESKCLELRSQLAMHEAELLQLKRTWERIVSRGFEFPHTTPATSLNASTPSPPTIYTPGSSNAVLEGLKESVQGVSRLFASGLSTSNADRPNSPSSHILSDSKPRARPTLKPRPHSLYLPPSSSPSSISHIRSSNLSTSSTCTTATSTTKVSSTSPSSVSTFFEEPEQDTEQKLKNGDDLSQDPVESSNGSPESSYSQELIVRDTGATPTVSPNPTFKFRIERRRERESQKGKRNIETGAEVQGDGGGGGGWNDIIGNNEAPGVSIQDRLGKDEQREGTLRTLTANSSAIDIDREASSNTRCHRRKSREASMAVASFGDLGPAKDDESQTRASPRSSSPSLSTKTSESVSSHMSVAFVSSGLNSSPSVLNASLPPPHGSQNQNQIPTSWTKRWTLGKSQKRASLLLSDVSQTLVSAFSLAVGNGSGSGSGSFGSSTASGVSSNSNSNSSVTTSPPGTKQPSMSWIDQDDEGAGDFFSSTSAVLKPIKPVLVGGSGSVTTTRTGTGVQVETGEAEDDDGEWGW